MAKQRVALILSLFALGLAGCGGDDDDEATTIPTVPLSVPGSETTPGDDDATTGRTVDTTPEAAPTPTPAPAPTPTPTPTPEQPPDSPENDTPPPPGPAEEFEDFCAENPGAC